jgi:ornithine cyclodeaminase/alanine dehydrogenase-like protein (mu-crystallin family)
METLLVTQAEVPELLPMRECIEVMAATMKALANGETILPLRSILWLPERAGALGLMPGALLSEGVLGLKAITFFSGNEGTAFDTHQGAVLLFEAEHGSLLAVIDATSITGIRTAAVSAVATRALAREDAGDLAILGSGVQARTHLEAMACVRKLRRVRVASRSLENATAFAERESKRQKIAIEVVATPKAAIEGADLICTATSARDPIVRGEWIAAGAHINAVGSSVPFARELDTEAVRRSRLYADRRESIVNEAGDFLIPKKEAAFGEDHIVGELGEVLIGKVSGRRSGEEITLFKSLGLAVEDVASARHIYETARRDGLGRFLDFGGHRHEGD